MDYDEDSHIPSLNWFMFHWIGRKGIKKRKRKKSSPWCESDIAE